jgi:hypothetical protein
LIADILMCCAKDFFSLSQTDRAASLSTEFMLEECSRSSDSLPTPDGHNLSVPSSLGWIASLSPAERMKKHTTVVDRMHIIDRTWLDMKASPNFSWKQWIAGERLRAQSIVSVAASTAN